MRRPARVLAPVLGLLLSLPAAAPTALAGRGEVPPEPEPDPTSAVAGSTERTMIAASRLGQRPWRSIALVNIDDDVVCTGFIVVARKVVTAAHCLTRDAARGDFRLRKGLPGVVRTYRAYSRSAGGTRYPVCRAARVWAHPRFIRRKGADRAYGSRAHDYAVITTEEGCSYPSSAIMRLWATGSADEELASGDRIKLGGYPADPRYAGMNGLNLWRSSGEVRPGGSDERVLNVTGFVAQGMSGAPVWRSFGSDSPCGRSHCVVGVVTECAVNERGLCKKGDSARRAVRITPEVKRAIKKR